MAPGRLLFKNHAANYRDIQNPGNFTRPLTERDHRCWDSNWNNDDGKARQFLGLDVFLWRQLLNLRVGDCRKF
jgi:hypothetical protein